MRWVDHWIGLPACFVLGALVTVARAVLPRRDRTISGNRTLAVFKFFGLGSITEATPLLRAIRQRYPESRLAFVTFEGNAALLERLDVCTDLRLIRTRSPLRFVGDVLAQIFWLRRHRVEAVVDLEFFSKFSTLLSFLSGAPVRVGFHLNDFWRRRLVTHPIYFNYYRHITDVYEQAARRLDVDITDRSLTAVDPGEDARHAVRGTLERNGWTPGNPLLGVNVNAGDMSLERRWPIENFATLIESLADRHPDLWIVLTGAPAEKAHVSTLADRLSPQSRQRVIDAAGLWSLDEFLAALSLFDAYLTNDSGPMHLAAAQGTPLVSLWGPGRPGFYAPHVPNHRIVYSDYPCSPCLYMFTTFEGMWCGHEGWCMRAIEPQTVLDEVETVLNNSVDGPNERTAGPSERPGDRAGP